MTLQSHRYLLATQATQSKNLSFDQSQQGFHEEGFDIYKTL
jgi:hypothetical protein